MKTLITIAFLILSFALFGQVNDETAFFDGTYDRGYTRRNNIKTVTATTSMDTNIVSTGVFYFDKTGLLQKENIIDSSAREITRFTFMFNKHHDLITRITHPHKNSGSDTVTFHKVYKGKLMVKERLPWSTVLIQHVYNKKGQRIKSESPYNNGGEKLSRRVTKYDYDSSGRLAHVTDCIYSVAGTIEQWMSDRTFLYLDNKIQKVLERIPNGDIPVNRGNLDYAYDSSGKLKSIVSDTVTSYYYTYNDKGLLKSKREKFPEGFDTLSTSTIITRYSYTFWN